MPENNFTNPTLEAFSGTNINVEGGPGGFDNVPDGFGTRPALYTQLNPNVKPPEPLQTGSGDLFGSLNKGLSDARQPPKGFTPGTPTGLMKSDGTRAPVT